MSTPNIPDDAMKSIFGWNIFLFSYRKVDGNLYGLQVPAACLADAEAAVAEVHPEAVYDGVLVDEIPFDDSEGGAA